MKNRGYCQGYGGSVCKNVHEVKGLVEMAEVEITRLHHIRYAMIFVDFLCGSFAGIATHYLSLRYEQLPQILMMMPFFGYAFVWMYIRVVDERISFQISELKREQQQVAPAVVVEYDLPPDVSFILKPAEPLSSTATACSICMEHRASICFVPCGHQCICDDCVPALWDAAERRDENWKCPICRTELEGIVRPIQ